MRFKRVLMIRPAIGRNGWSRCRAWQSRATLLVLLYCACTNPQSPDLENEHDPKSSSYIPNAPSGLVVASANDNNRVISWQDNSGFEHGYRLERKMGAGGTYILVAQAPANVHSLLDTMSILTDTTYFYRVCALSAGSAESPFDSAKLFVAFPRPTDLHMTCLSSASIKCEWTDNSTFELGYHIEESVNNQPFTEAGLVAGHATSFVRTNLNSANTYRFRVRAFSQRNLSAYSNTLPISLVTSQAQLLYSRQLSGPDGMIRSLAFSPDGEVLACGVGPDVDIVRVGDGKHLAQLPQVGGEMWSVRYSPDGKTIAEGESDATYLWDAETYALIARLYFYGTNEVYSVRFTPGGDTVASCDDNGNIQFWRTSSRTYVGSIYGFNGNNRTFDISPNGQFIATGDELRIVRLADNSLVRALPTSTYLRSIAFHPSGRLVACVGGDDYSLQIWDVVNGTLVTAIQESYYLENIAFDASGDRITAAGRQDALVNIWQVDTGTLLLTLNNGTPTKSVAFSPMNNIIATGDNDRMLNVWGFGGTWRTVL